MIGWGKIVYGAVLSTVIAAAVLLVVLRGRQPAVLIPAVVATLLGPIAWNAILHRTDSRNFFVDFPFKPLPVSWQDTGSGVFTLAVASVLLGITLGDDPARHVVRLAVALVALLVDIPLLRCSDGSQRQMTFAPPAPPSGARRPSTFRDAMRQPPSRRTTMSS
jgi:hypothetical protein